MTSPRTLAAACALIAGAAVIPLLTPSLPAHAAAQTPTAGPAVRHSAPLARPAAAAQARHRGAHIRMMTWNVLDHQFDGTYENGNRIAPWHKRIKVVVPMIEHAHPDIVVINEANDWVGAPPHRQIDTLQKRLHRTYALADADFTINRYHPRTGNYIFYRRSMFRPLYRNHGRAHYWTLSKQHMVTYQALKDRRTGAKMLLVAVHLSRGPNTTFYDAQRKQETARLLADVRLLRARHREYRGMPVVYGGDFNTFDGTNPANHDSPDRLFRQARLRDALRTVHRPRNTKYGSVNGYTRVPSHTGRIIDEFYATRGVAFHSWKQVMHLRHGRWPGTIPSDHNPILVGMRLNG